jgi:hypothetical protein
LDVVIQSSDLFVLLKTVLLSLFVFEEAVGGLEDLGEHFFAGLEQRETLIFGGNGGGILGVLTHLRVVGGVADELGVPAALEVLFGLLAVHLGLPEGLLHLSFFLVPDVGQRGLPKLASAA